MHLLLNGWRRFGIVATVLWLITVIGLAALGYTTTSDSLFVYHSIPVGTTVAGNKVTLPDGRAITLTEEEEFKLRYQSEQRVSLGKTDQPVPPWKLDWSSLESVPKIAQVRWVRLALFALLFPLMTWLLIEAGVLTVAWVRQGFAGAQRDA